MDVLICATIHHKENVQFPAFHLLLQGIHVRPKSQREMRFPRGALTRRCYRVRPDTVQVRLQVLIKRVATQACDWTSVVNNSYFCLAIRVRSKVRDNGRDKGTKNDEDENDNTTDDKTTLHDAIFIFAPNNQTNVAERVLIGCTARSCDHCALLAGSSGASGITVVFLDMPRVPFCLYVRNRSRNIQRGWNGWRVWLCNLAHGLDKDVGKGRLNQFKQAYTCIML